MKQATNFQDLTLSGQKNFHNPTSPLRFIFTTVKTLFSAIFRCRLPNFFPRGWGGGDSHFWGPKAFGARFTKNFVPMLDLDHSQGLQLDLALLPLIVKNLRDEPVIVHTRHLRLLPEEQFHTPIPARPKQNPGLLECLTVGLDIDKNKI